MSERERNQITKQSWKEKKKKKKKEHWWIFSLDIPVLLKHEIKSQLALYKVDNFMKETA